VRDFSHGESLPLAANQSGVIRVVREAPHSFEEYSRIPIAFDVQAVLDVHASKSSGSSAFDLTERRLDIPYVKDYDTLPGEGPAAWSARFDTSRWAVFAAYVEHGRVGGAVGVIQPDDTGMLDHQSDLALLQDIRVAPSSRGQGIGGALLAAVEHWARDAGARVLVVETQNVNVPACRFYARNGFDLRVVNRHAYPELPDEIQMLWHKRLDLRA
jgi:GNAT superfamily N-acetyltransferase